MKEKPERISTIETRLKFISLVQGVYHPPQVSLYDLGLFDGFFGGLPVVNVHRREAWGRGYKEQIG